MKLAVVQHHCRGSAADDRDALAIASERALARGADAVILPEVVAPVLAHGLEALGRVAIVTGDAALDAEQHRRLLADPPDVLVLAPGSESELQAEGVIELAIKLSTSVAGLVIVVEPSGAEPGMPGHGGSAVILLGEVLAEAIMDDQVLTVELPQPVPQPEPRAPLPEVPPILLQRLAHHRGERPHVDYLADLG